MIRDRQRESGTLLRNQLGDKEDQTMDKIIPGYESIRDEMEFGAVWNRKGLSMDERLICVLASLVVQRHSEKLRAKLLAALDSGLSPRGISEVILQAGIYGGLPSTEAAARVAADVFNERGISVDRQILPAENWETLVDESKNYQKELHGERWDKAHADPKDDFTSELYKIATIYGYGLVWRRPGLDIRKRLIVAIACFASLGSLDSFFVKFCHSAIEHGISVEEIREIVIQLSPYIGFPLGLSALSKLKQSINEK